MLTLQQIKTVKVMPSYVNIIENRQTFDCMVFFVASCDFGQK